MMLGIEWDSKFRIALGFRSQENVRVRHGLGMVAYISDSTPCSVDAMQEQAPNTV